MTRRQLKLVLVILALLEQSTKQQEIINTITTSNTTKTTTTRTSTTTEDESSLSLCIPASSNCFLSLTTQGCEHIDCESKVCECDPYCCNVRWDLSCSGYPDNYFTPGCSARVLCCANDPELFFICSTFISQDSNCLQSRLESATETESVQLVQSVESGGCDDLSCQELVCECDPYCCNIWDDSCVGDPDNYFNPGCSARLLCCVEEERDGVFDNTSTAPTTTSPVIINGSTITNTPTITPSLVASEQTSSSTPIDISILVPDTSSANTVTNEPTKYCNCYRQRVPTIIEDR